MSRLLRLSLFALAALGSAAHARWPFATPGATPAGAGATMPPPRDVPLVERKWADLSNQEVSREGQLALAIDPQRWRHAESASFILHYRRVTEAQKVVREIEYDLWFVAMTLGAGRERFTRKLHVYVFEDEAQWKDFLAQTKAPGWFASFAKGDELFLSIRRSQGGGTFDSHAVAHETTHAVVTRLYPQQRWPLWLNEGFAEYMGSASVAARKNQTVKRHERQLTMADIPLTTLVLMEKYPTELAAVGALYQSSEKLIRFLMTELPPERITRFIDTILAGQPLQGAVMKVYADRLRSFDDFERRYARFSK